VWVVREAERQKGVREEMKERREGNTVNTGGGHGQLFLNKGHGEGNVSQNAEGEREEKEKEQFHTRTKDLIACPKILRSELTFQRQILENNK